jgi:hypothetical protein
VLAWVQQILERLALSPEVGATGAFRVIHGDRAVIVVVFDYCENLRFQPGGAAPDPRLAVVVNSVDHAHPLARRQVPTVSLASLVEDDAALAAAVEALPRGDLEVRAGMSVHERARRGGGHLPSSSTGNSTSRAASTSSRSPR